MKEKIDVIWKRGYHEGDRAGFRKATEDMKKGTVDKSIDSTPEYDQIGRVTRANAYEKAFAFGFQSGYYDAITGGHRMDDINEIRRLAGLKPINEVTRRDFMKKAGAGAAAAGATMMPGSAGASNYQEYIQTVEEVVQFLDTINTPESKEMAAKLRSMQENLRRDSNWSKI